MSTEAWTPPAPTAIAAPPAPAIRDIHSFANVNELKPTSLHLDWTIDWKNQVVRGTATHELEVQKDATDRAVFDTSYLTIHRVLIDGQATEAYERSERRGPLGEPLTIQLSKRAKGDKLRVEIEYETTSKCTALGWLDKSQTHAQKTPFLYSQCQAIHARSLLPCMDSPSRKITYTATVRSEIPVLMSALQDKPTQADVYTFRQPVAIPTYLIAIVGGLLEFRRLGPRTGVWAEPPDADRVQWEFEADAERFLTEAEKLVSPYAWTRYDSVVLPPSFPYGGMENANLTTLTPALVCGDRSSTDVLLHELCHSWSGNLISCMNWESFWLNEGWTVYLERLLLQIVHKDDNGAGHRGFSYIIGHKAMKDSLHGFADKPRFQRLVPLYHDGEDPDDAFSSIPYDKGANFLLYLEGVVGGLDAFVPYIKAYFTTFAGRSISTDEWKAHLLAYYEGNAKASRALREVDWDAWLHGEGADLPVQPEYDSSLAFDAFALAARWSEVIVANAPRRDDAFSKADIEGLNTMQVVVFLERLHDGPTVPAYIAEWIDDVYGLSSVANTEVRLRFYEVALEAEDGKYAKAAAEWGRMKYCRTIYKALHKVAPKLARDTFLAHESFYHPIAAALIRKDLAAPRRAASAPARPLVAVIGSTGTGKSQLAVELAQCAAELGWHAEAISADSMQTYEGLDVITNKADVGEQQGVPHHLLSFLPPGEEYDVTQFVHDTQQLCDTLHAHGGLPVLVGGTTYYVQHFLFPGRLVSQAEGGDAPAAAHPPALLAQVAALPPAQQALWHQLGADDVRVNAPPNVTSDGLWALLHALDPDSASRWHYKDKRKVYRSLRILYDTGVPQSSWLHAQDAEDVAAPGAAAADTGADAAPPPPRRLLFWVWSERDPLNARLEARIHKMVDRGLLDEIRSLRAWASQQSSPTDYTRGIFQAIGYKEFDAYLTHCDQGGAPTDPTGAALFQQAIESMQVATRRYAKRQTSWIRRQLLPAVLTAQAHGEDVTLFLLDATDLAQWNDAVAAPAKAILLAFLRGETLPDPRSLSAAAHEQLAPPTSTGLGRVERNRLQQCEVCTAQPTEPVMVRAVEWERHLQSRSHRRALKRRTKAAYVAARRAQAQSSALSNSQESESDTS